MSQLFLSANIKLILLQKLITFLIHYTHHFI